MAYLFNGNTVNTGVSANTLTVVGSPSFTSVAGLPSVFFNNPNKASSVSDNYYIATTSYNIPMTISVWIYTDLSYYMTVLGLRGHTAGSSIIHGIQLDITISGEVGMHCALPTPWTYVFSPGGTLKPNTWTHIVITITSSYTATLYVNSVSMGSGTGSANLPGYTYLVIGSTSYDERGYHGYIRDLRMYSRALFTSEISSVYTSGRKYSVFYIHTLCIPLIETQLLRKQYC